LKICVADDEKEVRESIVRKIKSLFPEDRVFDIGFGRAALDGMMLVRPDLAFLDIRMPEMDGLEILREVKKAYPHMHVVILSGYDDFEYARGALQGGAMDYLLKPADRDELREVIEKAKSSIHKSFLKDWEIILEKLSLRHHVFLHDLRCRNPELWFDERLPKNILFGDPTSLEAAWAAFGHLVLCSFMVNMDYMSMIVSPEAEESPSELPPGSHGEITFSDRQDFLPAFLAGMDRWESRRFFASTKRPAVVANDGERDSVGRRAAQWRNHLLTAAKNGDHKNLEPLLNAWLESLLQMEYRDLKRECTVFMALLDEGLSKEDIVYLDEEKIRYWSEWTAKHRTWDELERHIRKFVLEGIRTLLLLEHSNENSSYWFEQALRLIHTSRDPNLSLETVAEAVGVHPVTLSRMFKQRTGTNFVRYLIRSRLSRAKTLLLKTNKKINEISQEVGYVDYRYFRNLFKKEFGLTPSEFRRQNGVAAPEDSEDPFFSH